MPLGRKMQRIRRQSSGNEVASEKWMRGDLIEGGAGDRQKCLCESLPRMRHDKQTNMKM
jgi:hypothetical protein